LLHQFHPPNESGFRCARHLAKVPVTTSYSRYLSFNPPRGLSFLADRRLCHLPLSMLPLALARYFPAFRMDLSILAQREPVASTRSWFTVPRGCILFLCAQFLIRAPPIPSMSLCCRNHIRLFSGCSCFLLFFLSRGISIVRHAPGASPRVHPPCKRPRHLARAIRFLPWPVQFFFFLSLGFGVSRRPAPSPAIRSAAILNDFRTD